MRCFALADVLAEIGWRVFVVMRMAVVIVAHRAIIAEMPSFEARLRWARQDEVGGDMPLRTSLILRCERSEPRRTYPDPLQP